MGNRVRNSDSVPHSATVPSLWAKDITQAPLHGSPIGIGFLAQFNEPSAFAILGTIANRITAEEKH